MTMPHMMNCAHSEDGWCLSCVANMPLDQRVLTMCDVQTVSEAMRERELNKLRADLATVTAERDRLALLQQEAIANEIDRDEELQELRARLAEYENAPVVAVVRADYNDTDAWNFIDCDNMPEAGTELIARPKVQK